MRANIYPSICTTVFGFWGKMYSVPADPSHLPTPKLLTLLCDHRINVPAEHRKVTHIASFQ